MYTSILYEFQLRKLLPESFFLKESEISYTVAGSWDDWTYATQHTIPMTLEMYHQKDSEVYTYQGYNGTHHIFEFNTMFEYFAPPSDKLDTLHADIINFELFWLGLTPFIDLDKYDNYLESNGDSRMVLHLFSNSRFFNTTDIPQVVITPSHTGIIKEYPTSLTTLMPKTVTLLPIIISKDIPKDCYFDINVTSEWAGDFHMRFLLKESQEKISGFSTALNTGALITLVFYVKKKVIKG